MSLALLLVSVVAGILSGILGIGGAVVLIPLMRVVPPLLGAGELTMGEIAGITMAQVLAASIAGWISHKRGGHAHTPTVLALGLPMAAAAFIGAYWKLPDEPRRIVFGSLVAVALLMLFGKSSEEKKRAETADDAAETAEFSPNIALSGVLGGFVGLAAGIVGAGGGFMIIPLMIRVLKAPMRIAVGSSLGIVVIGAVMGTAGKAFSGQIEWSYLPPVILGSIPASIIGSKISRAMNPGHLRKLLILIVSMTFVHTWWEVARDWKKSDVSAEETGNAHSQR